MRNGIPEGWGFESADWSVGICGDSIWHDDCPAIGNEYPSDDIEKLWLNPDFELVGMTFVPKNGYTELVTRTRYTCKVCGEFGDFFDTDIYSFESEWWV
jgi:hypothetical protein